VRNIPAAKDEDVCPLGKLCILPKQSDPISAADLSTYLRFVDISPLPSAVTHIQL
jgi:hypothetical protein